MYILYFKMIKNLNFIFYILYDLRFYIRKRRRFLIYANFFVIFCHQNFKTFLRQIFNLYIKVGYDRLYVLKKN